MQPNEKDAQPGEVGQEKETNMAHVVRIKSKEQHIDAIRVLNNVAGTWQAVGTSSDPVLLLTDTQFNALVAAGVVPTNDKEVKPNVKKATNRKAKS